MKFSDIRPFVRHAQRLEVTETSRVSTFVARDCRLFFCTEGEGEILLSGVPYRMQKGALVIIPAGSQYTVLAAKANQPEAEGADSAEECGKCVKYIVVNYDYGQNTAHLKYPIPPVQAKYFKQSYILENVNIEDIPELNEPIYLPRVHRVENKLNKVFSAYTKKVILTKLL